MSPRTRQMPAVRDEAITLSVLATELVAPSGHSASERMPTRTIPARRDSARRVIAIPPTVSYIHFGRCSTGAECGSDAEHLFITLRDDCVSWEHAMMERTPTGWTIRDSKSTNGTLMQGSPLTTDMRQMQFDGADQCVLNLATVRIFVTRG